MSIITGRKYRINSFSFTAINGGSGHSETTTGEAFKGSAVVLVTAKWQDRYCIGKPVSNDLIEYLRRNAHPNDFRVIFHKDEIIEETKQ